MTMYDDPRDIRAIIVGSSHSPPPRVSSFFYKVGGCVPELCRVLTSYFYDVFKEMGEVSVGGEKAKRGLTLLIMLQKFHLFYCIFINLNINF